MTKKIVYQFSVTSVIYFTLMAAYVTGQALTTSEPLAQLASLAK